MTDNEENPIHPKSEEMASFSKSICLAAQAIIHAEILEPEDVMRALVVSFWGITLGHTDDEHFEENTKYADELFFKIKELAITGHKELEFDQKHKGSEWGTA